MPAKCEPLGIKSNKTIQVTNSAHTTVGSMCWCMLNRAQSLCTCLTVHTCCSQNRPLRKVLFTKSPVQKKWRFSTPSKWTGGLTGTKKSLPLSFFCSNILCNEPRVASSSFRHLRVSIPDVGLKFQATSERISLKRKQDKRSWIETCSYARFVEVQR